MGGAAHAPSKLLLPDLPPGIGQARGLSAGTHPSPDQPTAFPLPLPPSALWRQICLTGSNRIKCREEKKNSPKNLIKMEKNSIMLGGAGGGGGQSNITGIHLTLKINFLHHKWTKLSPLREDAYV